MHVAEKSKQANYHSSSILADPIVHCTDITEEVQQTWKPAGLQIQTFLLW